MARTLFLFALIIAAASAFVQPTNHAGEFQIVMLTGGVKWTVSGKGTSSGNVKSNQ
jgi:hypothetical protein